MLKAITKKLLITSVTIGSINPFVTGLASAEDLIPENSSDNTVEVTETDYTINGKTKSHSGDWYDVFGGGPDGVYASNFSDDSSNNRLTFRSGTITDILRGGYTYSGNSIGNRVTVYSGDIAIVYGGDSHTGDVLNNVVTINGGNVKDVKGGMSGDSVS